MSEPVDSTDAGDVRFLADGPTHSTGTLVLAHGAGAPMDSPFMTRLAAEVVAATGDSIRVLRFEFPYMAKRRRTGKRGGPDGAKTLVAAWHAAIQASGERPERLVIGGKSMGGRIASMVADDARVGGVVCLGYPFHPPGKPDRLRTEHLASLATPTLIVQGERDPFGTRDDVLSYDLASSIRVEWMSDGDHSFKPRVRSGHTEEGNLLAAAELTARFVLSTLGGTTPSADQ